MTALLKLRLLLLILSLFVAQLVCQAKTVRLLTIGNSFAENALTFLPQIVETSDNSLIVGRANLGGCTLERHWKHAAKYESDSNDPDGSPYSKGQYSLAELLLVDQWDFVTIQQVSWQSHDLKTYFPYIQNLLPYIRERAPQAEIYAQQIWAYRVDDPRYIAENAGKEPHSHQVMFEQVREAYHYIARTFDLSILPSGDAMFLADTHPKWGYKPDTTFQADLAEYPSLPDQSLSMHAGWRWRKQKDQSYKLRLDGHHASNAGKYLLGCVWFEVLFDQNVEDNSFVPEGLDQDLAQFLRRTAHQAVTSLKEPWNQD